MCVRARKRETNHGIIASLPGVGNWMFRVDKKEGQKSINHGVRERERERERES